MLTISQKQSWIFERPTAHLTILPRRVVQMGTFGPILGQSWTILDVFGSDLGYLGPVWTDFDRLWLILIGFGSFDTILDYCNPFWIILDQFWLIWDDFGSILDNCGPILEHYGPFWTDSGPFWSIWDRICSYLHPNLANTPNMTHNRT